MPRHNFRNSVDISRVVVWYLVRIVPCVPWPYLCDILLPWPRICILPDRRCMWGIRDTDAYIVWQCVCVLGGGVQNTFSSILVYLQGVLDSHHLIQTQASFHILVLLRSSAKDNGGSLQMRSLRLQVSHHFFWQPQVFWDLDGFINGPQLVWRQQCELDECSAACAVLERWP